MAKCKRPCDEPPTQIWLHNVESTHRDIIVPTAATIPRQTLSELCLVVRFDRNLPSFASAHQSLASSQQRKPIWRCTTVPVYHQVRLCHQTAHVSKPTQYANKKSLTLWQVLSDNLWWETSKIQHWWWIAEDISKSAESNPGPKKMGSPIPIWEKSPNNPVFFLGALPSQIPRPSCESLNLNILGCVCVFSPCGGRLCVSSQPECCQCNQPTSVLVTFLLNTPTIWLLSRYCLIAM